MESFNVRNVDFLGEGHSGQGGEDGGVSASLAEVDGLLHHLTSVVGELDERSISLQQLVSEVFAVLDGSEGVVRDNGGSRVVFLFDSSDFLDQLEVLFGLDQLVAGGSQLSLGLSSLGGASVQGAGGSLQGLGGIGDFASSEADFIVALFLLSAVKVVVGELFLVDGILEVVQHSGDGVEGVSGGEG